MVELLKNCSLAETGGEKHDVLIEDGLIAACRKQITPLGSAKVTDLNGLTVFPGLCDMHVHFREPGQTHKEDFHTGANAAAAG